MHTSFMSQFEKAWPKVATETLSFVLLPNKGGDPLFWVTWKPAESKPELVLRKAQEAGVKVDRSQVWSGTVSRVEGKPQFKIDVEASGAITARALRAALQRVVKAMADANERDDTNISGAPLLRAAIWAPEDATKAKEAAPKKASLRSKVTGGAWSKLKDELDKLAKTRSGEDFQKRATDVRSRAGAWLTEDAKRDATKDPEKEEQGWQAWQNAVAGTGALLSADEEKFAVTMVERRYTAANKIPLGKAESVETLSLLREDVELLLASIDPDAPASPAALRLAALRDGLVVALGNAERIRKQLLDEGIESEDDDEEDGFGTYHVEDPPAVITTAMALNRVPTVAEWQQATTSKIAANRGSNNPAIVQIDTDLAAVIAAADDATRFTALTTLERTIYAAIDKYDVSARDSVRMPALLGLLDSVQAEYKRTVTQGLINNPVALGNAVSGGDPDALADWNHLVAGTGKIVIHDTVRAPQFDVDALTGVGTQRYVNHPNGGMVVDTHDEVHAGFREGMLAEFARLMQNPSGKKLVHTLQTVDTGVALDGRTRAPNAQMGIQIRPEKGMEVHNAQQRGQTLGAAAKRLGPEEQVGAVFGAQRGTEIRIPDVSRDSDGSPAVTRGGRPMLTPVWLVLGHELIHAKHNLTGRNRKGNPGSGRTQAEQQEFAQDWTNDEEQRTIAIGQTTENRLRRQAGLWVPRFGHHSDGDRARQVNAGRRDPATSLVVQLEKEVENRVTKLTRWEDMVDLIDLATAQHELGGIIDEDAYEDATDALPTTATLDGIQTLIDELADAVLRLGNGRSTRGSRTAIQDASRALADQRDAFGVRLAQARVTLDAYMLNVVPAHGRFVAAQGVVDALATHLGH